MNKRPFSRLVGLGFTLPEILVAMTLIAVLAAVIIPAMLSQAKKGDPTRVGNDVVNIRSAAEGFLSDVRRYPASVGQLITPIVGGLGGDKPLSGTMPGTYVFGAAEAVRWSGPYVNEDPTAALATGFGWKFQNAFGYAGYGTTGTVANGAAQKYLVLTIGVTDAVSAQQLDAMFDDGDLTAGLIRYRVCSTTACTPTSAADTVKFLLMPIY